MARYNDNGCMLIGTIIFVIYLLFKFLELLLSSKNEEVNLLGIGLIIFIIVWLFWYFNKDKKA